jgi:hypothetical protein
MHARCKQFKVSYSATGSSPSVHGSVVDMRGFLPCRANWLAVSRGLWLVPASGCRQSFFGGLFSLAPVRFRSRRFHMSDGPKESGRSYLFHMAMVFPWRGGVTRQKNGELSC